LPEQILCGSKNTATTSKKPTKKPIYETGSIILTSNKFFSDWGKLMSDAAIATAVLDRLLHHAHVINIRGESYRLKDRLKTGAQAVPPTNIPAAKHPAFPSFSFRR
jgi:hypothetical protein